MTGDTAVPDLYDLLQLPRDATASAIKAAYRRLAKTAHPDVGGDAEAFRLLTLAYDVLSDDDKRRFYDETGRLPDDHQAAAEDAALRAALGDIVMAVVAEIKAPDYEDVLALVRLRLAETIRQCDQQIARIGRLVETTLTVSNRIQVKEGDNLLRDLLRHRMDMLADKRQALQAERNRHLRIGEFLDNYDYFLKVENVMVSTDTWRGA